MEDFATAYYVTDGTTRTYCTIHHVRIEYCLQIDDFSAVRVPDR